MELIQNLGVGVDIESIDKIRRFIDTTSFLNKVFTKRETDYCQSKADPAQHFAARFAGKEAVIKAVSSSKKITLEHKEIEILNRKDGAPVVQVKNKNLKNSQILISLSHQNNLTLAFALLK